MNDVAQTRVYSIYRFGLTLRPPECTFWKSPHSPATTGPKLSDERSNSRDSANSPSSSGNLKFAWQRHSNKCFEIKLILCSTPPSTLTMQQQARVFRPTVSVMKYYAKLDIFLYVGKDYDNTLKTDCLYYGEMFLVTPGRCPIVAEDYGNREGNPLIWTAGNTAGGVSGCIHQLLKIKKFVPSLEHY